MPQAIERSFATPMVVLTAPVIYGLIVPFALLDLCVTVYQSVCFRAYGIPRVRRADFIRIDRHHLQYLNALQKLNCVYCGYCNGLIAYIAEVAGRTEAYWCPIKHAQRLGVGDRLGELARHPDLVHLPCPFRFPSDPRVIRA